MEEKTLNKTPRDILRIAFRHRYLFLVSASLTAIAALLYALPTPVKYTSRCEFQQTLPFADTAKGELTQLADRARQTMAVDIVRYEYIREAMRDLGMLGGFDREDGQLTQEAQFRLQNYIRDVQSRVGIQTVVGGHHIQIFRISFTDESNRTARDMANLLVSKYIDRVKAQTKMLVHTERKNVEAALNLYVDERNRLHNQKDDLEKPYGAHKFPESPAQLKEQIGIIEDLLMQARNEHRAAENKLKGLVARADEIKILMEDKVQKQWGPNPKYDQLKSELENLEHSLLINRTQLHRTENHPDIKRLVRSIEGKRIQLADTPDRIVLQEIQMPEELPQELLYQIENAKAEVQRRASEIDHLQEKNQRLIQINQQFGDIQNEYWDVTAKLVQINATINDTRRELNRLLSAERAELTEMGIKVDVRQLAQLEEKPSSPEKMKVLGLAVVAALGVGGGLVFLMHFFDRTVTTPDDAAKYFGVPVHGVIGEIVTPKERILRLTTGWFIKGVVGAVLLFMLALSYKAVDWKLEQPKTYERFATSPVNFVLDKLLAVPNKLKGLLGDEHGAPDVSPARIDTPGDGTSD